MLLEYQDFTFHAPGGFTRWCRPSCATCQAHTARRIRLGDFIIPQMKPFDPMGQMCVHSMGPWVICLCPLYRVQFITILVSVLVKSPTPLIGLSRGFFPKEIILLL